MALPPPTLDTSVVVTGASAGIATELVRQLAGRGHDVVPVAREQRPRMVERGAGAILPLVRRVTAARRR